MLWEELNSDRSVFKSGPQTTLAQHGVTELFTSCRTPDRKSRCLKEVAEFGLKYDADPKK